MGQWTDYFRIVEPKSAATDYAPKDHVSGNVATFANYSWYTQLMTGSGTRNSSYNQYDGMDSDVDVARALDTIAEEMSGMDESTGLPFQIDYQNDDNKEVDESVVMTVKAALRQFSDIHDLENRIFRISRNTVKYGDCFFRKWGDHTQWEFINPTHITGIEIDKGKPSTYHVRTNPLSDGNNLELDVIDSKGIVHFTLSDSMEDGSPFGDSILRSVVKAYKQKGLLEDAIVIYRVVRAPERRVFYVDVGNMPPQKVKTYLETVKNEMKQKRVPNSTGGTDDVDAVYNPTSMQEDYFFAQTANSRGSRVETLPGGASTGENGDLVYFQDAVFRGLRVPSSYMRSSSDGGAQYQDGKVGIAYIEEMRFANFVKRLQNKIEKVFDAEFKIYLSNSGIKMDDTLFKLRLPDPQNFALYRQAALDQDMMTTFTSAEGVDYLSKRFILKKYLGYSEDDIQTNEALLRQERQIADGNGDGVLDLQQFYDPAAYENRAKITVETNDSTHGDPIESTDNNDNDNDDDFEGIAPTDDIEDSIDVPSDQESIDDISSAPSDDIEPLSN